MTACGRFAPSPTGLLHLGNARTALLAWLWARSRSGRFLLRIEDLDPDRSRTEYEAGLLADLRYLGLDWDAPPVRQSERQESYDEALRRLTEEEWVYPCFCSRAEIARAASAPQGDEGPRYPGTCAHLDSAQRAERARSRASSLRFRSPSGEERFWDEVRGGRAQDVQREVGDFVVRRADGVASYQLAVVLDDAAAGVSQVLRGDDLLASTPRQVQLLRALGLNAPAYAHVPLLQSESGERLAKRGASVSVKAHRERGVAPEWVVGWLGYTVGLGDGSPVTPAALLPQFNLSGLRLTLPFDAWPRLWVH